MRVKRERWRVAAGEYAALLTGIPGELDRLNGRALALGCPRSQRGALAGFIASQIWGLGTNGYGSVSAWGGPRPPGTRNDSRKARAAR